MSRVVLAIVILCASSALAHADVHIELPKEVRGEPGDWITVPADTEGKVVRWVAISPGLKVFPVHLLKDTKTAVVTALAAGNYKLLAYTAAGDEPSGPAMTTIVIAGGPAPPPGPGPNPPPGPVDPLTKKIQDALAADPGTPADKLAHATKLAGFYSAMSKHVGQGNTPTIGDLLSDYQTAMRAVLPDGVIPGTRKLCGQLVFELSGDDADRKIDEPLRKQFVELFDKLALALAGK